MTDEILPEEQKQELSPAEQFAEEAQAELQQVQAKLSEINLLIEQSQGEVDKLAQRNASITTRLHQIQSNFDTVPREDIRSAYESAQDAQQRLFTMRGQLEKLESDRGHLERRVELLNSVIQFMQGGPVVEPVENGGSPVRPVGIEQVIEAQEEERRRLSRQIHDGPAQALSNFILQTEIAMRLFDASPEDARGELISLKDAAASTFSSVRDFIFDLRPMMLDDLGVAPTVRRYAEAFEEKSGLEITCTITGSERRLESYIEVLIFRAVQEFLANAREHAQATTVKILLDIDETQIRAIVEDNGRGIDPSVLEEEERKLGGLNRLRERVVQLGGSLEVDAAESGTRIIMTLPLVEPGA